MTARAILLRLVRRIRQRAMLQGVARAGLAAAAGLGAAPLLSGSLLPWLPDAARPAAVWAFAALGVAGSLAAGWFEWRRARPRLSWAAAATLAASLEPGRRNEVHTGADLAAWGPGGAEARGTSEDLATAQIEMAAAAAETLDPARALPAARILPSAGAACAVVLLLAGWASWNPGRSMDAWRALLAPKPIRALGIGNLKLVYEPPAYAGLPKTELEGVSGAVEALRGTRVTLEGQISEAVDGGRWLGPGGQTASLETRSREFRASWVLDRPGSYDLEFHRGGRTVPTDFRPQPLTLKPDDRPTVELRSPPGDLETASDREVEIRFTAADDLRVDRAELVLQGETEIRLPVSLKPGPTAEGAVRFLPLAYPKLGAGSHLRVEVWDSDTVSGPKTGSSRSIYLSFLDRKKVMEDIQGLEARLLEALLTHLADQLETPGKGDEELSRLRIRAADLLKLFESLAARVRQVGREDSPAVAAVLAMEGGLRAALGPFAAGAGDRGEVVAELERDILFLDRLMKNLRMEEALHLGDDLASLQRSLFDDLQAGRNPKDLLERVSQIEDLLRRMAERLSGGSAEMPDSFVNADAVKDMPDDELQEQLKQLKKALQEGRTADARRIAEKLLGTLDRWLRALQDAAERAAGRDMDPLMRDLARLESEALGLAGDQERILQGTRAAGEEGLRRAGDSLRREMAAAADRLLQRLNAITDLARRTESLAQRIPVQGPSPGPHQQSPQPPPEAAPPFPGQTGPPGAPPVQDLFQASGRVHAAVAETRQALRTDLGRARSSAEAIREAFRGLRETVERDLAMNAPGRERAGRYEEAAGREVQAILQELDALEQRRRQALSAREIMALRGLGAEEQQLGERTGRLGDKLDELSRRTPFLGPGLPQRARAGQAKMGEAARRLGQADPFGAIPAEGEALEELSAIAKALGEARRQAVAGGKGRGGFSMMRLPGQGEGGGEVDRSRVEIPREAELRELKAFREEVLKAMRRGGYPKDREEEVERYYERLIR